MTSSTMARDSRWGSKARTTGSVALSALLSTFAFGCQQSTLCTELGDCGGDLHGSWVLGPGHNSCSEDVAYPPADTRLRAGDVPPLRVPAPEQAFADWCSGLIAGQENILAAPPSFFSETLPFGGATVRYKNDGTYAIGIYRTGYFYFDFSGACMRQFGAGAGGVDVCKQLEVPLAASGAGEGSYQNLVCNQSPTDPLGCLCLFDVAEVSGSGGRYELSANQILHLPNTPGTSFRATYCRTGEGLQLTGTDGSYLLNKPALRTLDLGRVNCADGVQGPGETGVDCGDACDVACAAPP